MESSSKRVQRVQRELFETLSRFLLHEVAEPLPCYVSITAVDVYADLRTARVFFRLVGSEAHTNQAKEILQKERPHFQKRVARDLQAKFCPVLKFEFGVAPHLDPIDEMLENLRKPKNFGD